MEFPELGSQCAVQTCRQLDFLPNVCDTCHGVFCHEHSRYEDHQCGEAYLKDVRVPICPLCDKPVPVRRGEDPNIKVNEHISQDCHSEKAGKISSRCSFPGCKGKELVPIKCAECNRTYCLRHRFTMDHNCTGPTVAAGRNAAKSRWQTSRSDQRPVSSSSHKRAATAGPKKPQQTCLNAVGSELNRLRQERQEQHRTPMFHGATANLQQQTTEDEALTRAIQESLRDSSVSNSNVQPLPDAQTAK
ncbi:AN1-type zinc finger protein 2A-like isoform X2 [Corticium candelabrum]|uniref:AN1-type zinc finger protein 2A-like isoform X2 n=1 Tax=Corticium candelabrum TaxID=121492 RepID=UPI002E255093|nr:AN1-type zinc finger protein 2A-like isoform X2 [Corticium candelabrum]